MEYRSDIQKRPIIICFYTKKTDKYKKISFSSYMQTRLLIFLMYQEDILEKPYIDKKFLQVFNEENDS